MNHIKIEQTTRPKAKPQGKLQFGHDFTDHMFIMDYDCDRGWHNPCIMPYGPVPLDPSCMCLHYSQEVFEGLKAYKTARGEVQLFRPQENFKRLNQSCDRLCIPKIDEQLAMEALLKLVDIDRDWVPCQQGASLYIRPFIIATEPTLGVHASKHYKFFIIMSPSGAYYANGLAPVKIFVETKYVRAVNGGTGFAKTGGNYAASLKAQNVAAESGYEQVLWLDGVHHKYVEEVGAMNVFFKINGKIVTPKLDGSILPGITRKSVIQILTDWGYDLEERLLSIDELIQANASHTLEEAWGSGTAAVISPIGELSYNGIEMTINHREIGPVAQKLYDELTGIQWGKIADPHNWIVPVNPA